MAFKMKGAPLMDTSKKHGTNKNFMKSGMKNADGSAAAGAPFLGGIGRKILDPLGLFGKGKGKRGACPPGQMQPPVPRPAEPTGTPAPAAAAPAPAPAAEEAQPAATMKKDLLRDKVVEGRKKRVPKPKIMDVKPPNYKPNRDKLVDPRKTTTDPKDRRPGGALPDPRMVKKKGGAPMAKAKAKKKVRKYNIMDAKPPNYKKPKKRTIMDPYQEADPKYRRGGGVKPRDKSIKKGAPKLKGGQHKIDMNKDGKLSKADFDMMNKKGAPMAKKEGAPLKGILRKGDKMVKDLGDKYSKSSLGKAMGKADKFIANLGKKKK